MKSLKTKKKKDTSNSVKYVQCHLQCEDTHLTTHIESVFKKKTIKQGMLVELKDDERKRLWEVIEVYGQPVEKSSLNRGWDNNY